MDDIVFGNLEETLAKMMQADPNFVMGKVMSLSIQLLGESPRHKPKLLYDVNNFMDTGIFFSKKELCNSSKK